MTYTKKFEPVLTLNLRPSRRLQYLIILIHLLAIIASLSNDLPILFKLAICSVVICHWIWFYQHRMQTTDSVKHSQESGWQINEQPVIILASTVVTQFMVFLHFTEKGAVKQRNLLIPNDALTPDEYRQLVVRLKISFNQQ